MMRSYFSIVGAFVAAGCAGSGDRARQTPDDAAPARVSLTVGNFQDTDQNRYLDSTVATVYVWAAAYPIPMRARGTVAFELQTPQGAVLASWQFDATETAAAMREMAPGPGFVFDLSLLGHDRIEQSEAELVCKFTPVSGKPLYARPGAALAIGPTRGPRG